jgi:predicted RNA binding protein YcfA (HicA-like mRNA interferase family)
MGIPVHRVLRAVEKAGWKSIGKKGSDQVTDED